MNELEKLEKMELQEEKEYNFLVKNDRENYHWFAPWYNPNIYLLSGGSILDLLANVEIKELKGAKFVTFGDDWALFKKGKKLIMVMADTEDDIEQDEIKVTVHLSIYS
ncbi:MAG: hypothetical protein ACP5HH_08335 [Fervidicoccaceae archaeon]